MSVRKTVLITGASQGIGAALAICFAKQGYNLILTARSKAGLEKTAETVRSLFSSSAHTYQSKASSTRAGISTSTPIEIDILPADLSRKEAPFTLIEAIRAKKKTLDVLVNNAGFGYVGDFKDEDLSEALSMLAVNIHALLALTSLCLPLLREKKGGILNVSSVAGFAPGPGCALYSATKAFVLSFSEALYQELKPEGMHVSALCPGATQTGFFKRAHVKKESLLPSFLTRNPDWTASIAVKQFLKKKRVIIPGFLESFSLFLIHFIPNCIKLKLIYLFTSQQSDTS